MLIGLGLVLAVAYAGYAAVHFGGHRLDSFFVNWVYDAVAAIAFVLCAWRAIRVRHHRTMWALIAAAFVLEVTGNTVDSILYGTSTTPVPSAPDVFWAAFYVPMIGALAVRVRAAASVAGAVIIDILIATCALGSVSAGFVLEAILVGGTGSPAEFVTTLAYPVADLVLVALVLQLAAAGGWRLGRATSLIAGCFVLWSVTDTVYAFETARGTYAGGGLLDLGWVVPYALFGVAAWVRPDPPTTGEEPPGWLALIVPVGFGGVAVAMVVYSAVARINLVAVGLATGALVFVIARFVVTFRSYLAALGKTRLILETAPDAFISFDATGAITDWNPQAQASFGWSREDVIGRDLAATILTEGVRDEHRRSIERFLATRDDDALGGRLEQIVLHRDGHQFPIESTISPLETDAGYSFSVFARDITARRRAQEELALARDEALEASRMKSMFVANVSHEIRTPMNGVIGMADVLLATRLDAEQRECAETISFSGEALLGIIDDILDFSKIEAGKLELDPTDFDPAEVIERACGMLAIRADEKGLELVVAIEPDLPARVHGDAARLSQVITNLVSNAIKFTREGEVVVRATANPVDETGALVRVEVSDTGTGIEPEALARLFTPFSQADGSTTRKYGGTGLGLAISRQLIELMGGRVDAESQPGRGSRFSLAVWLPRPPAAAAAAAATAGRPEDQEDLAGGLRVLVVDDNPTARTNLERQLRAWQVAECDGAGSAGQALELLDRGVARGAPYGLAFIDLSMPDVDGPALARAIRGSPALRATRLVALTPAGQRSDPPDADSLFDGSVSKPVRRSRLLAEIRAVLAGERPTVSRRPAPVPLAEPAAPSGSRRCVLVVEDTIVNQTVAARMLERCGFRAQIARNGREALEALTRGSFAAALMDCQMPELDGYETTREIRRREQDGRRMPIIAMTASSMRGDRERCLAAGMDDYLTKPLRSRGLADALATWVTGRPPDPTGDASSDAAEDDPPGRALLDEALIVELEGLGLETLTGLVSLYVEEAARSMSELRGAIDLGEPASVARLAHTLKGASGAVGARHVARLAAALELSVKTGSLAGASQILGDLRRGLDETTDAFRSRAAGATHSGMR